MPDHAFQRAAATTPGLPTSSLHRGAEPAVAARAPRSVTTEVALVSYEAFCAKYRPLYARYAAARLESAGRGADIADAGLSRFARCWPEALTCASPAAVVWKLFTRMVDSSARHPARPVLALPCPQADTVILRHRLGLAPEAAADVMGISASEFSTLHQAALRALSAAQ